MAMSAASIDQYLRQKGSPLVGYGHVFVEAGRKYGVDPRLVVSIMGAESSFGKTLYGKFNPFGWGPGQNFGSFSEAIDTITKGLKTGYIDQGLTRIDQIASKWAPVGASNDPSGLNRNWTKNVSQFYREQGGRARVTMPARGAVTTGNSSPSSSSSLLAQMFARSAEMAGLPAPVWMNQLTPMPAAAPAASSPTVAAGESPALAGRLAALQQAIQQRGGSLSVTSGYRTVQEQQKLWNDAVAKYGSAAAARKWVAPPGASNHNKGVAADLAGNLDLAHQLAPQFGLKFPMPWEPWHIEVS